MAPRITLLSTANGNSSVRTWSPSYQASVRASSSEAGVLGPSSDASEESASEVDELDDSDAGAPDAQPQWQAISSAGAPSQKAAVKKPRPKPPTTRVPGQTIVPVSRVEAILVADGLSFLSSPPSTYANIQFSTPPRSSLKRGIFPHLTSHSMSFLHFLPVGC